MGIKAHHSGPGAVWLWWELLRATQKGGVVEHVTMRAGYETGCIDLLRGSGKVVRMKNFSLLFSALALCACTPAPPSPQMQVLMNACQKGDTQACATVEQLRLRDAQQRSQIVRIPPVQMPPPMTGVGPQCRVVYDSFGRPICI